MMEYGTEPGTVLGMPSSQDLTDNPPTDHAGLHTFTLCPRGVEQRSCLEKSCLIPIHTL